MSVYLSVVSLFNLLLRRGCFAETINMDALTSKYCAHRALEASLKIDLVKVAVIRSPFVLRYCTESSLEMGTFHCGQTPHPAIIVLEPVLYLDTSCW